MNNPQTAPLVSIIVPIYNTEKYIEDCLNSILAQTFTHFEAILVNDGSTDQSGIICDKYALIDERFNVIHQKNQGVTMARIAAFENSHGEYITFVDSDDYVSSDYLEKLVKPLIEEDADIVCCKYNRVRNNTIVNHDKFVTGIFQGEILRDFISTHFFYNIQTEDYGIHPGLATKMVRRCLVIEGLRLGKDLWYGEDTIAVFCMLFRCKTLVALPDKLYNYVMHDNEAINRYDNNLWWDIIELLQRIESLCYINNTSIKGLRFRIWKLVSLTIIKMLKTGTTYSRFCNDLSAVRNHPFMINYFEPWLIDKGYGVKGNIGYILLKLKMFRLFWLIKKV